MEFEKAAGGVSEKKFMLSDQSVDNLLLKAKQQIDCKEFESAISSIQEVLDSRIEHPLAKFMLGDILIRIGAFEDALPCFESAIQSVSDNIIYWKSYLELIKRFNNLAAEQEALTLMRNLFGAAEDSTPASKPFDTLYNEGRYLELDAMASRSIAVNFNDGLAWRFVGVSFFEQSRYIESQYAMEIAIELLPTDPIAHFNYASLLSKLNLLASAERHFREAIRLNPQLVAAYNNLGNCLRRQGRLDEAESYLRMMVRFEKNSYIALVNLVGILEAKGEHRKAFVEAKRALKLAPDSAEVRNALGSILNVLGKHEEALTHLIRAVELNPDFADAYNNIGTAYFEQQKFEQAKPFFLKAIAIDSSLGGSFRCLGQISQSLDLNQEAAERYFRTAIKLNPKDYAANTSLLFLLSERGVLSNDELFQEHLRFGENVEKEYRSRSGGFRNTKDPQRRIRIGVVSGDLNNHAVASFIAPIFSALHQSSNVFLVAYDNNAKTDFVTQELKRSFDRWHKIDAMSDADLFNLIQADGIDILCDLAGHTSKNRLVVMARKPAPIQLSWIGYPGTTGLRSMDYYIADRFYLPKGEFDRWFTEKLAYIPCTATFQPSELAPQVSPLPATTDEVFTFGSFNRLSKISIDTIRIWANLLRAVPKSRLIIGAMPDNRDLAFLQRAFVEQGVDASRLSFESRTSLKEYLEKYKDIDLCLDTFPFNGGTTTHQGLWMGVPTLSINGKTIAARSSAAILGQIGLNDFLALDEKDLIEKAIFWNEHRGELAKVRSGLRQRCQDSIKSHPDRLAVYFDKALRQMWVNWCDGNDAKSFDVEAL